MSAYGSIDAKDIGVGMLAPYTASTSNTANPNTMMKTGGKKKSSKKVSSKKVSSKKASSKKVSSKKLVKKSTKTTKRTKKMKGGMETEGATSLPQRFFNPNMNETNYSSNSGKGVESAYGPVQPNDIGQGLLAPYTSSNSPTANHNTMMKTGGNKKNKNNKKNLKGGKIPSISTNGVTSVQNKIDLAVNDFSSFLKNLDDDYVKSTEYAKNIKIGNERLIQGGKKKSSSAKKSVKKSVKKTRSLKMIKGGDGSDFASTLNSRGPFGAPDNYWDVDGLTWFRQFNKTGQYIPNSQLANAATPLLAGNGQSNVVSGYDESIINNGNSNYI
jgi:hypothetical protein